MRSHRIVAMLTLLGLAFGLSACFVPTGEGPPESPLCYVDPAGNDSVPGLPVLTNSRVDTVVHDCIDDEEDVDVYRAIGRPGEPLFVRCVGSADIRFKWQTSPPTEDGGFIDCGQPSAEGGGVPAADGDLTVLVFNNQDAELPRAYKLIFTHTPTTTTTVDEV